MSDFFVHVLLHKYSSIYVCRLVVHLWRLMENCRGKMYQLQMKIIKKNFQQIPYLLNNFLFFSISLSHSLYFSIFFVCLFNFRSDHKASLPFLLNHVYHAAGSAVFCLFVVLFSAIHSNVFCLPNKQWCLGMVQVRFSKLAWLNLILNYLWWIVSLTTASLQITKRIENICKNYKEAFQLIPIHISYFFILHVCV